ncbi:uncharacterized protein LOC133199436 [Saccostrea echinata]|uniref:uncharacterized protein LOC133199436 n=1 Tax=Saccostrea echinata TaxID=191078 RepID=UPI002A7FBA70|nr:uncharacterized protein LOC133199436 [Saccostrea echinata]
MFKMEARIHSWILLMFMYITKNKESECATIINEDIGNLSCHKCEETFKQWDPYTICQIQPNNTPKIPCLKSEPYCMVERISVMGLTTSIKRECAAECYYGCRSKNFGVTTVSCTSCCQTPGCNTGNSAEDLNRSKCGLITPFLIIFSLQCFLN